MIFSFTELVLICIVIISLPTFSAHVIIVSVFNTTVQRICWLWMTNWTTCSCATTDISGCEQVASRRSHNLHLLCALYSLRCTQLNRRHPLMLCCLLFIHPELR